MAEEDITIDNNTEGGADNHTDNMGLQKILHVNDMFENWFLDYQDVFSKGMYRMVGDLQFIDKIIYAHLSVKLSPYAGIGTYFKIKGLVYFESGAEVFLIKRYIKSEVNTATD